MCVKVVWKCKLAVLYYFWRNLQLNFIGEVQGTLGIWGILCVELENKRENHMLSFK